MSRLGAPALGPGRIQRLRTVVDPALGTIGPLKAQANDAYITYSGQPAAGKTITVQVEDNPAVTFKFVVAVADDWDVKIGTDMDDTYLNLENAWNMTAAPGVGDNQVGGKYKVPNYLDPPDGDRQPWADNDEINNVITFTCFPKGKWGNSIQMSWTLSSPGEINLSQSKTFAARMMGIDNTPGKLGDIYVAGDTIFLCTAECGWAQREATGDFWKKIQLTATL